MTEQHQHIATLIAKSLQGLLSPEEKNKLEAALDRPAYRAMYDQLLAGGVNNGLGTMETIDTEAALVRVMPRITDGINNNHQRLVHRVHFLRRGWFKYAAAIIILIGAGVYLWNITRTHENTNLVQHTQPVPSKNDIGPGSDRAVLTLSDGRNVELTAETNDIAETGTTIQNLNGGLTYGHSEKMVMNTMSTPRGGQYQLTLADGTKVWLNAASSITYPTAFTGNTREVQILGEAYFEIAPNKSKPFIVKTSKENITVLGTEFNVNAYPDEEVIKTSLVEGSVKINATVLQPGQAYINGKIIKTNIEQDIAWKNGYFSFANADIKTVMRQLSRWYDVEVKYEAGLPAAKYSGEIGRNLTLKQVMALLTKSKFDHIIEGRTITILPKK
ncbi:MAG: FecR family protein [Chitinophagaceae bacterium]|nr:FecR family protein [Chitinophagaceae bacterium]